MLVHFPVLWLNRTNKQKLGKAARKGQELARAGQKPQCCFVANLLLLLLLLLLLASVVYPATGQ